MSDYLLDTDVLLRCLRGAPDTLAQAQQLTVEGDLHTSVWSHLELWLLAQLDDRKKTLEFLAPFITHPLNDEIARRAAELMQARSQTDAPLSYAQAVIVATTLQHGLTLVSYSRTWETLAPLRLLAHSQPLRGTT